MKNAMMGKVEASASSSASPTTVYRVLKRSGVVSGSQIVGGTPFERVDLRKPSSALVADYFGRIELIGLSDGGTLIRWRVVFRARLAGTVWLVQLALLRSTSRRVRRLARFAVAHDYDTPPY